MTHSLYLLTATCMMAAAPANPPATAPAPSAPVIYQQAPISQPRVVNTTPTLRERIRTAKPHAVLSVERGGAFLAEVLASAGGDFPPSVAVPKKVTPRPGQEDKVERTPHLEAEIRRRIANGETHFAIVDFYMGGHFAEELETMFLRLHADFPELPLRFEPMWLRETHGPRVELVVELVGLRAARVQSRNLAGRETRVRSRGEAREGSRGVESRIGPRVVAPVRLRG